MPAGTSPCLPRFGGAFFALAASSPGGRGGRPEVLRPQGFRPDGSENAPTSTPPCRKSKDYHVINLYDDIAPGSVSFHHSLESDLGEYGGFPILEYVVGSFGEIEAVQHDPSLNRARCL
jgi:hypothetical protein